MSLHVPVLILPGIGDSGPQHWQSLWQAGDPAFQRVMQRDWNNPICSDWCQALEHAVGASGPETILVAHSLGCLLVAHWAAGSRRRIQGALLVAPPDPSAACFPSEASGFAPVPAQPLPFESMVVASSNDLYGSLHHASACAAAWNSRLVNIGDAGHINGASDLGQWPEGYRLLRSLVDSRGA